MLITMYNQNVWFIQEQTPIITEFRPLLKDAMIKDGCWEDCEMSDEDISDKRDWFIVNDDNAKLIQSAYDKIRLRNEDETEGALILMSSLLQAFGLKVND